MSKYIIDSVDIQLKQDIKDATKHPKTGKQYFCLFKSGDVINAKLDKITKKDGTMVDVVMLNKSYALPYIPKSSQKESPYYTIIMTHGHMEENINETT